MEFERVGVAGFGTSVETSRPSLVISPVLETRRLAAVAPLLYALKGAGTARWSVAVNCVDSRPCVRLMDAGAAPPPPPLVRYRAGHASVWFDPSGTLGMPRLPIDSTLLIRVSEDEDALAGELQVLLPTGVPKRLPPVPAVDELTSPWVVARDGRWSLLEPATTQATTARRKEAAGTKVVEVGGGTEKAGPALARLSFSRPVQAQGVSTVKSLIDLNQDMHVHSTYSDGKTSVGQNISVALQRGLGQLMCVDHVREDTRWLRRFVSDVTAYGEATGLDVGIGVEAKFVDTSGRLDLPRDCAGVDRLYAADHRLPYRDTTLVSRQVKCMLMEGRLNRIEVIALLADTTVQAMRRYPGLVVAHLFSFLPKVGISEDEVPTEYVMKLVEAARETDAVIELDERWSCPNHAITERFSEAGVTLWASSDAHDAKQIGRYDYVARIAEALARPLPESGVLECAA